MLVLIQRWTEYESGWGQRPDGISVHFNESQRQEYITEHREWQHRTYGATVPDEYDAPAGNGEWMELVAEHADENITKYVLVGKSFRTYQRKLPWLREIK